MLEAWLALMQQCPRQFRLSRGVLEGLAAYALPAAGALSCACARMQACLRRVLGAAPAVPAVQVAPPLTLWQSPHLPNRPFASTRPPTHPPTTPLIRPSQAHGGAAAGGAGGAGPRHCAAPLRRRHGHGE